MAKRIGRCERCGQSFKRSRVTGRKKGYRIVHGDDHDTRIQCEGCGRNTTIDHRPA